MNHQNNFAEMQKTVAQFILENLPEMVGQSNQYYNWHILSQLHSVIEGEPIGHDLSFEFKIEHELDGKKFRADCHLNVGLGRDWDTERTQDGFGMWIDHQVKVEISWPSWGATDIRISAVRIALMQEISEFAQKIYNRFKDEEIWELVVTREEMNEQARKREEAKMLQHVTEKSSEHCKGLMVGRDRRVFLQDHGFVAGTYTIEVNKKTYTVNPSSNYVFIRRIA